ncbi:MAG: peptidase [Elusimicrobia bacterium GWA2_61_42]|nr:MAG: peptidase [Elusimicrobia bacterium GWA2_61_42]OGR74512.1 MAG: peptidase [Elusimicrobia bacterium GWC2_61_25]
MSDKNTALFCLESLKQAGADKAQCVLTNTEKHEFNVDCDKLSLLRTGYDTSIKFTAIKDGRRGTASLNGCARPEIEKAAASAVEFSKASPSDPAYDIAPAQPAKVFESGLAAPDLGAMYDRLSALLAQARAKYPRLKLVQAIVNFNRKTEYFLNSNGVDFTSSTGYYDGSVFFLSQDGKKTSSFNYSGFTSREMEKELIGRVSIDTLFRQSAEQLDTKPLNGKFEGEIIVTPDCLINFLQFITAMALRDASLISGSSVYKDKLGRQIASPGFTLHSRPVSYEIVDGYFVTPDGFEAENTTIIENGVLKTFLLSLYGANKTGLPRVSCSAGCDVIEPGDKTLEELAAPIKKGLLVTRVSGNNPNESGDFSGVAKNSYYIENGKILYPVSETMISCNIPKMFMDIRGISKERVDFGSAVYPWLSFGGVTVSGK